MWLYFGAQLHKTRQTTKTILPKSFECCGAAWPPQNTETFSKMLVVQEERRWNSSV